jgi:hypothetical protein
VSVWQLITPAASVTQQAPVGGGGGVPHPAVAQLVPLPRYVPLRLRQIASVVCTQNVPAALVTQQAPVVGAGWAMAAEPAPSQPAAMAMDVSSKRLMVVVRGWRQLDVITRTPLQRRGKR